MKQREKVRRAILKAEPFCRRCGGAGAQMLAITVLPIVPIDMGGSHRRANLQPVCKHHAAQANAMPPAQARILRRRAMQRQIEALSKWR